jgi:ribosomal protein S4
MDLEERRSVQAEVDELLRSNQLDVVTAATGAKKALASRQWQRAKNAVAAARDLVSVTHTLNQSLVKEGICVSFAECRRLVESKGVRVNGSPPPRWNMRVNEGDQVQVGQDKTYTV